VKTRLTPPFTPAQALVFHRALVEDTLERLERCARPGLERWLCWSEAHSMLLDVTPAWRSRVQTGDDLGERMDDAFRWAHEDGRGRVVILGSDSPTLPLEYVNQAFDALGTNEVVLGPADDGGYYLVGTSVLVPEMFRGIEWGSPRVLDQTTRALSRAGRSFHILPSWYDVDTARDLLRLQVELQQLRSVEAPELPRRTAAVVSSFFAKGKNTS
jgi:rSAM/selenodomain-associated transferase 1